MVDVAVIADPAAADPAAADPAAAEAGRSPRRHR